LDFFADYHTHTKFSHGKGTVEDNVRAALAKGLKKIAISDHGPALFALGVQSPDTFLEIKREVEKCKKKYPGIDVLTGVEANVVSLKGELDLPKKILDQLDLVMVGLHPLTIPLDFKEGGSLLFHYWGGKCSKRLKKKSRILNTKVLLETVYKNKVDVITHPGHKMSIDTKELARACVKTNTALEINAKHSDWQRDFIETAKRTGVKFVLGSDAHSPAEVGELEAALRLTEAAGLGPEQVLNVL
jgi:putative hydrolase